MKSVSIPILIALALASLAAMGCNKGEKAAPGSGGSGAASAQAPATPPVAGDLVITATLQDIAGSFPANDIYNYAYVMKYKVDQVHQGSFADKEILVGHYNPRLAREEVKDDQDAKVGGNVKGFQVGDTHYLVLSPMDGLWTGAVEDDYYKDKSQRWWALWADKTR